jgi:hypothetical protein
LLGETKNRRGEAYPVPIPGSDKVIRSDKVEDYVRDETFYYFDIYTKYKHLGNPFSVGWAEWPIWLSELIVSFDRAVRDLEQNGKWTVRI